MDGSIINYPARCSVRLYLQLFVGGLMSYLRFLCFFAHSGVQDLLCCVFVLFFFPSLFKLSFHHHLYDEVHVDKAFESRIRCKT
jgi:hypothetical protein